MPVAPYCARPWRPSEDLNPEVDIKMRKLGIALRSRRVGRGLEPPEEAPSRGGRLVAPGPLGAGRGLVWSIASNSTPQRRCSAGCRQTVVSTLWASRCCRYLFVRFSRKSVVLYSRGGGIRTHTVRILSPLPLPLGYAPKRAARTVTSITVTHPAPLPRPCSTRFPGKGSRASPASTPRRRSGRRRRVRAP